MTGRELIFLPAAGMVLRFGFRMSRVLVTQPTGFTLFPVLCPVPWRGGAPGHVVLHCQPG